MLLSLAALIFSGPLAGFVANGIGLILVGTCVLNVVLALLSSRPAIVGTAQDALAVVVTLIAIFGILPGVIAGLLIAVVLFVVTYSRIDVVKHMLTGANVRSRMVRSYAIVRYTSYK